MQKKANTILQQQTPTMQTHKSKKGKVWMRYVLCFHHTHEQRKKIKHHNTAVFRHLHRLAFGIVLLPSYFNITYS